MKNLMLNSCITIIIICIALYTILSISKSTETNDAGYQMLSRVEIDNLNQVSKPVNQDHLATKPNLDMKYTKVDMTNGDKGQHRVILAEDQNGNEVYVKVTDEHFEKLNKQAGRKFYKNIRGVSGPPPEGHTYIILPDGRAKRGEDGKPIIHNRDNPYFTIESQLGFAPTLEEYRHYQSLENSYSQAVKEGQWKKADQIRSNIYNLREEYKGQLPYVSVAMFSDKSTDSPEIQEQVNQILYSEYAKQGFSHLIPKEYR